MATRVVQVPLAQTDWRDATEPLVSVGRRREQAVPEEAEAQAARAETGANAASVVLAAQEAAFFRKVNLAPMVAGVPMATSAFKVVTERSAWQAAEEKMNALAFCSLAVRGVVLEAAVARAVVLAEADMAAVAVAAPVAILSTYKTVATVPTVDLAETAVEAPTESMAVAVRPAAQVREPSSFELKGKSFSPVRSLPRAQMETHSFQSRLHSFSVKMAIRAAREVSARLSFLRVRPVAVVAAEATEAEVVLPDVALTVAEEAEEAEARAGRVVIADSVTNTGLISANAGSQESFAGSGGDVLNPFIIDSPTSTPNVIGLKGGADGYGIYQDIDANDNFFASVNLNAPNDAIAAILLSNQTPLGDEYDNHLSLSLINLSSATLTDVGLGITAGNDSLTANPIQSRGFKNNPLFGGGGPKTLTGLGGNEVYTTLVPDSSLRYNFTASGLSLSEMLTDGAFVYLRASSGLTGGL